MESKKLCDAQTRAGVDCKNYAMKDHPCCRVHLAGQKEKAALREMTEREIVRDVITLPKELQDIVGQQLGASEMKALASAHPKPQEMEERAERRCASKYYYCKDAFRKQVADECTERCKLKCADSLRKVLSGINGVYLQLVLSPESSLAALTTQPVLFTWTFSKHKNSGTLALHKSYALPGPLPTWEQEELKRMAVLLPEWKQDEEAEFSIEDDDERLFLALCDFLLKHVAEIKIEDVDGAKVEDDTVVDAIAITNAFRQVLGQDLPVTVITNPTVYDEMDEEEQAEIVEEWSQQVLTPLTQAQIEVDQENVS